MNVYTISKYLKTHNFGSIYKWVIWVWW